MGILYGSTVADHVSFVMTLEVESLLELSHEVNNSCRANLDWSKLTNDDLLSYYTTNDVLYVQIWAVRTFLMGKLFMTCMMVLYETSKPYSRHTVKPNNIKPGWNIYVAAHHAEAKEAFMAWVQAGRPRNGPVLEYKKIANARYKYTI